MRFDPFADLIDLQHRINQLFEEMSRGDREPMARASWSPSVDIYEAADAIFIEADLPGLTREDVTVRLENDVLTIEGERKPPQEERRGSYHRIERAYGSFARNFTIPSTVQADRIEAEFKDGVLRVRLPKQERAKSKQIQVK
ncbi:MAG: Hsp20/alpha crystallin family protein [Acidobacteriota bacterium]|nr:Hsp20/alpha crystallin family protein [Blastocatellia bacterium]MDW8240045.1 Hsp20/alpha crystallin family protein [Acidobacteriota bacterium]